MRVVGLLLCLVAGCRLDFDEIGGPVSQDTEVSLLAGATSVDVKVCSESAATIDWVLTQAAIDPATTDVQPLLAGAEDGQLGVAVLAHGCVERTITVAPNEAEVHLLGVITDGDGDATAQIADGKLHPMFEARTFKNDDDDSESYVIHFPEAYYRHPSDPAPTLLFAHGWGQTTNITVPVPLDDLYTDSGFLEYFVERRPAVTDLPFIVIAPQCDNLDNDCWGWEGAVSLFEFALDDAEARGAPVDPHRLYATGISTGGEGAWRIAMDLPHVDGHEGHHVIAAAVPLMSTFDPDAPAVGYFDDYLCRASSIPIWAFHCMEDSIQPWQNDQTMVTEMNACPSGGLASVSIGHWEYQGSTHAGFVEVYNNTHGFSRDGQTSIYTWLLQWSR